MPQQPPVRMRRYQCMFFDAAGTLFGVRGSVGELYAGVASRYGAALAPPAIEQRFQQVFSRTNPIAFPGAPGEDLPGLERQWWRRVVTEVFEPLARIEQFDRFFDELFEIFGDARGWSLFEDVKPALDALQGDGLRLGVISNFDARLLSVLQDLGIADYFEVVVVSSRAGVAKPHQQIFKTALRHANVSASSALHIGDHLLEDYAGARCAGMDALWLDRRGRHPSLGLGRITQLADVVALLRSQTPANCQ